MAEKKFIKPSNRRLVFHKKSGRWLTPDEEKGLMELEKIKREQAQKQFQELNEEVNKVLDERDDSFNSEDELIICPKCKEWTESEEPCCP